MTTKLRLGDYVLLSRIWSREPYDNHLGIIKRTYINNYGDERVVVYWPTLPELYNNTNNTYSLNSLIRVDEETATLYLLAAL